MERKRWHSMVVATAVLVALVACAGPTEPGGGEISALGPEPVAPEREGTVPDPACNFQGGRYGHIKC